MIVINPTDKEIAISYLGTRYSCEPEGSVNVKEDVARFWKETHGFIRLEEGPENAPDEAIVESDEEATVEEDVSVEESSTESEEEESNDEQEDGENKEEEEENTSPDLSSLSRAELDEVAMSLGINPTDYKNKPSLIDAINSLV